MTRYLLNRQPGKALPYFLKLRRPGVFDLIRDHNLFTDVQDQALLLIEFDQDLILTRNKENEKEKESLSVATTTTTTKLKKLPAEEEEDEGKFGTAITLLVDHTHSIPVRLFHLILNTLILIPIMTQIPRVVSQLQSHRQYLYMYLDALFDKDPHLAFDYSDLQVNIYSLYKKVLTKLINNLTRSIYMLSMMRINY